MKAVLHDKQLLFKSGMTEARRESDSFGWGAKKTLIYTAHYLEHATLPPYAGSGKMRPMAETFVGGSPMSPKATV